MFAANGRVARRFADGILIQGLAIVAPATITGAWLMHRGTALNLSPKRISYAPIAAIVTAEELLFRRTTLAIHPVVGVASDALDVAAHRPTSVRQILILSALFTYFRHLYRRYGFITAALAHAGYDLVVLATLAAKVASSLENVVIPNVYSAHDAAGGS